MSDSERKLFPIESVIALINGKQDYDLKEISGYILGRSIPCDKMARAVVPFAAAWIARLCPKMADILWNEKDGTWLSFVDRCSYILGEKVSLPPMTGSLKAACEGILDSLAAKRDEVAALQKQVDSLTKQVEAMKPLKGQLDEAVKRGDKLEDQLKATKKEMGTLRRQALDFEDKVPMNDQELKDLIKDTIKANLKSIKLTAPAPAGAAAGAVAAAGAAAGAAAASSVSRDDEFGFGPSMGGEFNFDGSFDDFGGFGGDEPAAEEEPEEPVSEADEFGFGPSMGGEFGF